MRGMVRLYGVVRLSGCRVVDLTSDNLDNPTTFLGNLIARPGGMARRVAALFGFVAVVALALTLLYRVYIHHTRTEHYDDDGAPAVVALDTLAS